MSAIVDVPPERTKNDLCTPAEILDRVRQMGPIALDPCSNRWSTVGAAVELDGSLGNCGLQADWRKLAEGGLVWANPPYGRGHMLPWASKVEAEAARGVEIIALAKGDHSTEWHRVLRRRAVAMAYLWDRIAFEGGAHDVGNFASTLFYFGARRHLFRRAFEDVADVRPL